MEFCDTKPKVFKTLLPLANETDSYSIALKNGFTVIADKDYTISFWVRGSGFRRMSWNVECAEAVSDGRDEDNIEVNHMEHYGYGREFSTGQEWTKITETFRITKSTNNKSDKPIGGGLRFYFNGRGTVYLDDVTLVQGRGF